MNGDTYSSRESGRLNSSSRDHYASRDDRRRDRDGDRPPRRRSRSPAQRTDRREYNVDSYSTSRDYREREREERYSGGRDRRGGEREWDRDRGSARRDARRDDDDRRGARRDKDLFEDRRRPIVRDDRRGAGTDKRDADDMRQLARQKSTSPQPKKPKEPTPDLTDQVPMSQKKRRMTSWDIKPTGYEKVSAEQAKLSGMFPLPGAPRQQPMDASRLKAFMDQPSGSAGNTALKPSNSRQSKRLFVSNIPESATDDGISDFFNLQLNGLNVTKGVDPCISAQIDPERTSALLEFKAAEDATTALAMDGISMEPESMDTSANGESNGSAKEGLGIRRPKDYIVPAVTDDSEQDPDTITDIVPDTQNKLAITRIPAYIDSEQMKELVTAFGELKSFVLVMDTSSGQSRGIAFCEYLDTSTTELALESLNTMELGDSKLKAQKASIGLQQAGGEMSVNAMGMLASTSSGEVEQGRVLCLLNMVTPEELMDNDEYQEIMEDVTEEVEKYGQILGIKVPRPSGGSRQSNGVGKIYVKYVEPASAQKALRALAGRKFADRTVVCTFFGEEYFDVNAW